MSARRTSPAPRARRRSDPTSPPAPRSRGKAVETELAVLRTEFRTEAERWLQTFQQLQDALVHYQGLYDHSPVGHLTLDASGVILNANDTAAALLADEVRLVRGKPLLAFVERDVLPSLLTHLAKCRRGTADLVTSDFTLLRKHRPGVPVRAISRRGSVGEQQVAYHTVLIDLTEQARSERALAESERRYRTIVETANEGICIVDRERRIAFVNTRLVRMVGASAADDLIGVPIAEIVAGDDIDGMPGGATHVAEVQLRRRDGTFVWTSMSHTALVDDGDAAAGVLQMFTDISVRKELQEMRDDLVRRLVTAQESERRRIARELHDQFGQHLTGLSLGLSQLSSLATAKPAAELIHAMQQLLTQMARDAHHLALELRPRALDDLGLGAAVSNYADAVAAHSGLEIDVHCDVHERLDSLIETTVYRVVQEAVTNAVRHARAQRVSIIVDRQRQWIRAIIEDDGVGFPADRYLRRGAPERRLGLAGMQERASLAGGALHIESRKGHGTAVFLRVPSKVKSETTDEEASTVPG